MMTMTHTIPELKTDDFDRQVLQSDLPVVVDFFADWCGPCKMLAPYLEEMAREFSGRVKFAKVNVDDEIDLAMRFGISGIPTLVFFKAGGVEDSVVGLVPPWVLKEKVEKIAA